MIGTEDKLIPGRARRRQADSDTSEEAWRNKHSSRIYLAGPEELEITNIYSIPFVRVGYL